MDKPNICNPLSEDGELICWDVTVNKTEVASIECWGVTATQEECWITTANCPTGEPPTPPVDIPTEDNKIDQVFAIHISHGFIYLAVKFDAPDDEENETYLDEWGGANTQQEDGRWVYKPAYKAIEIVDVWDDLTGTLPHTVHTDEHGYKYITMPDQDIVFNVTYKMDHNHRIVKGYVGINFAGGKSWLTILEESEILNPDLIGNGCMLTQHESTDSYMDPIIFRAKTGNVYLVDTSTLESTPTGTANTNYMLNLEYGMTSASTTRFNFTTDTGDADAYPTNVKGRETSQYYDVMENDEQTIGFPNYSEADSDLTSTMGIRLMYLWYHEASEGGWSSMGGIGGVGTIIGGEPYNPDLYYTEFIPYIPNPLPPLPRYEHDALVGMKPYSFQTYYDGYMIPRNKRMSEKTIRMNINNDFFCALTKEVVEPDPSTIDILFLVSRYPARYPYSSMTVYKVCGAKDGDDYCYDENKIHVADGTNIIKTYSTFNML